MAHLLRTLTVGVVLALSLTACGGSDESTVPEPANTSAAAAVESAKAEGAAVVDVRTPEEFDAGHVEGATNIDVQADDFDDRIAELDRGTTYVVYCRSGSRSAAAAQRMRDAGLTVVDGGGLEEMAAAGYPVG